MFGKLGGARFYHLHVTSFELVVKSSGIQSLCFMARIQGVGCITAYQFLVGITMMRCFISRDKSILVGQVTLVSGLSDSSFEG